MPLQFLLRRFDQTFEIRWPTTHKKVVIEWHAHEGDLFFRPRGADSRVLWHTPNLLGKRTATQALGDAMVLEQLRRAWPLSENEFAYWNRTEGIFHRRGESMEAAFSFPEEFRWASERDFFFGSCDNVCSYLGRKKSPKTDFEWARLLVENNWEEWSSVKVERESPLALRRLVEALFDIYEVGGESRYSWVVFGKSGELWEFREIPSLITQALKGWFNPIHCHRKRVRGFSGWYNRENHSSPSVRRDPLSMHERLEKILLVREFLLGKLPNEEIESLLPR